MHTEDLIECKSHDYEKFQQYNIRCWGSSYQFMFKVTFLIYNLKCTAFLTYFFFQNVELFILVHIKLAFLIYALLTKHEVKMAGYWPSSFFAFLWTETKLRSIKTQKKERGQYPAIMTKQAWSIKDLLYGFIFKLKIQQ